MAGAAAAAAAAVRRVALGEYVYGADAVLAALSGSKRSSFHHLFVLDDVDRDDDRKRSKAMRLAEQRDLPVTAVSRQTLDFMSRQRPSNGIVLDAESVTLPTLPSISPSAGRQVWVALDQVMDPQNLGAILRSCFFFDVAGVVLCARNSAPLSPTVAKASCGALDLLPIVECRSMPKFLRQSRDTCDIIGLAVDPSAVSWRYLPEPTPSKSTLLVLGNERSFCCSSH